MSAVRITRPDAEDLPLSVAELKRHLRIGHDDDDAQLESCIRVAVRQAETLTGRGLAKASYRLNLSDFPGASPVSLAFPPVRGVTSISYFDDEGVQQSLEGWRLWGVGDLPVIYPPSPGWPSVEPGRPDAVTITFEAGCDPSDPSFICAETLQHAIMLLAAHFYEQPLPVSEVSMTEVPHTLEALMSPERIYR